MERISLPQNFILELKRGGDRRRFHIGALVGKGASCLVYEAMPEGSSKGLKWRVKELCPCAEDIIRLPDGSLFWTSEARRAACFGEFEKSLAVHIDFCNSDASGNDITHSELWEANGTLYALMSCNYGTVYSQQEFLPVEKNLAVLAKLARMVHRVHEQGYLHLDLKPENFLVRLYENSPEIDLWLFDTDSFAAISDIEAGTLKYTSYTMSWAAPEQKDCSVGKLCVATDVYAIGAMLFWSVFGRAPQWMDRSVAARWDIPVPEGCNPRLKDFLDTIFRKTLSNRPQKRYQTAWELAQALEQAHRIAVQEPWLLSNCSGMDSGFVGREAELARLHTLLHGANGHHALFLRGDSGIGKTALARAYAARHREEYHTVAQMSFRPGEQLESCLRGLKAINLEGDGEQVWLVKQKLLRDPGVLLIVDNFDVDVKEQPFLQTLLGYGCHVIITTRTDFSQADGGMADHICLQALMPEQLLELVEHFAPGKLTAGLQPRLKKIMAYCGYNTYAVEMVARLMAAFRRGPDVLFDKLEHGLYGTVATNITPVKDGEVKDDTVTALLSELFRLESLTEAEKRVIGNLTLLRAFRLDFDSYVAYTGREEDENTINSLVRRGWVKDSGDNLFLHSLMEEVAARELSPDEALCPKLFAYAGDLMGDTVVYLMKEAPFRVGRSVDEAGFEKRCIFLCKLMENMELTCRSNFCLVSHWLLELAEGLSEVFCEDEVSKHLEKAACRAAQYGTTAQECYELYLALFRIQSWGHCWEAMPIDQTVEQLEKQIARLPEAQREKALDAVASIAGETGLHPFGGYPPEVARRLYNMKPESFRLTPLAKQWLGLPLAPVDQYVLDNTEEEALSWEELSWQERIDAIARDFCCGVSSRSRFAQELARDEALTLFQKVGILELCLLQLTEQACDDELFSGPPISQEQGEELMQVAALIDRLRSSREWKPEYANYRVYGDCIVSEEANTPPAGDVLMLPAYMRLENYRDWQCLLPAVACGDEACFRAFMEKNLEQWQQWYCQTVEYGFGMDLDGISILCKRLHKCHYIAAYQQQALEAAAAAHGQEALFHAWEMLEHFAREASRELGEEDPRRVEFIALAERMEKAIGRLAGLSFQLREKEYC